MSYTKPQPLLITEEALLDIRKQYAIAKLEARSAVEQMEELVRINDERQKLFEVMQEQFDLLFAEVEELRVLVFQKDTRIKELEKEVKRLRGKKKPTRPIDGWVEV